MTPHVSQLAVEVFLASGERTKDRLHRLVEHFASTNAQIADVDYLSTAAEAAIRPWQWA